jgi:hypothetical protein
MWQKSYQTLTSMTTASVGYRENRFLLICGHPDQWSLIVTTTFLQLYGFVVFGIGNAASSWDKTSSPHKMKVLINTESPTEVSYVPSL